VGGIVYDADGAVRHCEGHAAALWPNGFPPVVVVAAAVGSEMKPLVSYVRPSDDGTRPAFPIDLKRGDALRASEAVGGT
jgi:hypothetical protein